MKKILSFAVILTFLAGFVFGLGQFAYIDSVSGDSFSPGNGEKSKITIYAIEPVNVQLQVFDDKDRLVREFPMEGNLKRGYHSFMWDGKDAKGRIRPAGVYKYLVTFWSVSTGFAYSETYFVNLVDYSISEVPPMPKRIITGPEAVSPFNIQLHGVSDTRVDYGDDSTRDDNLYERFNMDFKGSYGQNLFSDAALEYQSSPLSNGKEIDLRYAGLKYSLKNINADFFYKKYMGFYDTPLRLFASYKADRDRSGTRLEGKLLGTNFEAMYHKLNQTNETGIMARFEKELTRNLAFAVSNVNCLNGSSKNFVIGLDGTFKSKFMNLKAEYAQAKEDELDTDDSAWRGELKVPVSRLELGFAYQDIGTDFISYYSDVPNGQDTVGFESDISWRSRVNNKSFLKSSNITVSYSQFDNHFENNLNETVNARLYMAFRSNMSSLLSYGVTESPVNKTNNGFFTLNCKPAEKLDTNFRVAYSDSDTYDNISFRGSGQYDIKPGLKGVSEAEFSNRKLSVLGVDQEYDVLTVLLGISKEIFQEMTLYGHARYSNDEADTYLSAYIKLDYGLASFVNAEVSYGSFTEYEQQERLFGQMRITF